MQIELQCNPISEYLEPKNCVDFFLELLRLLICAELDRAQAHADLTF